MVGGWDHAAMHQHLKRLLATDGFDMVVLNGTPLCSYMPLLRGSSALKVLHLYDLESEFLLRKAQALPPGLHQLMRYQDVSRMRRIEERMLRMADLVLVTSDRERDILRARDSYRHRPIVTVPNGVDCRTCRPLPRSGRQEILYIGSMQYEPNVDAVLHFADAVWPTLHARFPALVFRVAGSGSSAPLARLRTQPGIEIMGEVPDVKPCYQNAALCVVPLRVGSGTRLKILEAMAFGRPVVSTALGCEGLDAEHNRHLLVANDPDGLRAQIERVLTDPGLAATLAANGRALVEQRYSWDRIAGNLCDVFERLVEEKKAVRAEIAGAPEIA